MKLLPRAMWSTSEFHHLPKLHSFTGNPICQKCFATTWALSWPCWPVQPAWIIMLHEVTSPFVHFHPLQVQRMIWLRLEKFEKGWRGQTSEFLLRRLGQSWDEDSRCANSTLCWWGALWQGQRFAHVFPQHKMARMKNENSLLHIIIATTLLKYLDSRLLPLLSMVCKTFLGTING